MADAAEKLSRISVESAATYVPMWTGWGVRDVGPLVHSLGCTFLTAFGHEQGFMSVAEVPAPRAGGFAHVEEDVRSDAAWFDRLSERVVLLAEFERYENKLKDLGPKVGNLLLAQHRWGCEDAVLLLAYWSVGLVTLPDHDSLRRIVREGYQATGGVRVVGNPRARIIFYQFVVQEGEDGLLRLSSIHLRGEP